MPYLNSNTTDLQPVQAGGQSFTGGQWSAARQSIIPDDAYGYGLNVDNDEFGNAITRRGSARVGSAAPGTGPVQGITQFYLSGDKKKHTVTCNAGVLYYFNDTSGFWSGLISSGASPPVVTAPARVIFAAGGGNLYMVNGANALWTVSAGSFGASQSGSTNLDPPPNPRDAVWHTNRLVLLGGGTEAVTPDPVGVYFSQFGTGVLGQWNRSLWSIQVGSSNDPATGILSWSNNDLLVMKESSIYVVNCNPTYAVTDFTVAPLHKNIGCSAPRTACQIGTDILLLAGRLGVIRIDRRMATDATTEIQEPISKPIQDIINRINWSAVKDNACATFWNNRYILSLPLDSDTTQLTTVVWNTVTQKWMGPWGSNLDAHCFSRFDALNPSRLRFGRGDGTVYEWLDYVNMNQESTTTFQDDGVDIPTEILSRSYDFSEPDSYKDLSTLKCEFFNSSATVDIGIKTDCGDITTVLSGYDTAGQKAQLPDPTAGSDPTTVLPFYLPFPGFKPKKVDLSNQRPCFEVAASVKSKSGKMVLRKVVFSAFESSTGVEIAESQLTGTKVPQTPGGAHGPIA